MSAEWKKTKAVDVARFYGRRLLRLYPLMVAFPIAMLVIFDGSIPGVYRRLVGIMTFST